MSKQVFHYWVQAESCSVSGIPVSRAAEAEGCAMPDAYLNARPVYFGDVSHCGDDGESYFLDACFADDGTDLSEEQLEQLADENSLYLSEQWFEHQVCRAENMRDYDMDR